MAKTRAQKNREIRQKAVREQLATYGLIQQVLEISNKLAEPDIDTSRVAALKASADTKLKLIDKYLPNLQAIEMEMGVTERKVVSGKPLDADEFKEKYSLGTAAGASDSIN